MPIRDLRELISILDRKGKLLRVTAEVDPAHELTCILMKVQQDSPGTAVYFEKIKGYEMPGVGNLYGSAENILTVLGKPHTTKEKDLVCEIADNLGLRKTYSAEGGDPSPLSGDGGGGRKG